MASKPKFKMAAGGHVGFEKMNIRLHTRLLFIAACELRCKATPERPYKKWYLLFDNCEPCNCVVNYVFYIDVGYLPDGNLQSYHYENWLQGRCPLCSRCGRFLSLWLSVWLIVARSRQIHMKIFGGTFWRPIKDCSYCCHAADCWLSTVWLMTETTYII